MLVVENLRFTYPALAVGAVSPLVLQDLSFYLSAGEILAVSGASGMGKSTLCHLLAGLAPRHTGGEVSGTLRVAGHNVLASPLPVGAVGVLFQDAAAQLFNPSVEDEVAWGLEALALSPAEISTRVTAALSRFGLAELRRRSPWTLSGGQQKRLALAALWAMSPQVMLLDEPLGGLDPQGRREVLSTLDSVRQEGTTLLLTSLRLPVMRLAPRLLLLKERAEIEDTADGKMPLDKLVKSGVVYPASLWPANPRGRVTDGPSALTLSDVHFAYPAGPEVLRGIDLEIPRGQFVAMVGVNGAGKSTLIRHLNGLLRPTRGRLHIMGRATRGRSVGDLARDVSFLFQRPERQIFGTTVREEVAYGPRRLRLPNLESRVARALERFALSDLAELPPAVLSYGAQRAVTLATLAAMDAPILVLDEPTVGLDGRGWAQLLAWLFERLAAGTTIIVVTHEMDLAARADRVITVDNGRIVADGPPLTQLPSAAPPLSGAEHV